MVDRDSPAARAYMEAGLPDPGSPWREVRWTVVDLETTGFDPSSNEIISFATVTVSGGRVRVDDAQYELVRPRRMPDADTIRIHGLREADLAGAPPLSDRLDGLLGALTGTAIVAHVAALESGFLGGALRKDGLELRNTFVDTAALDRELRRLRREAPAGHEPIGLSDMARGLGLPVHRPHHADGDALTTAQAFIALATHLDSFEPQTLGSLQRLEYGDPRPGIVSRLRGLRDRALRSLPRP
jgi:DNA polymerase III subunit epsilon